MPVSTLRFNNARLKKPTVNFPARTSALRVHRDNKPVQLSDPHRYVQGERVMALSEYPPAVDKHRARRRKQRLGARDVHRYALFSRRSFRRRCVLTICAYHAMEMVQLGGNSDSGFVTQSASILYSLIVGEQWTYLTRNGHTISALSPLAPSRQS